MSENVALVSGKFEFVASGFQGRGEFIPDFRVSERRCSSNSESSSTVASSVYRTPRSESPQSVCKNHLVVPGSFRVNNL